MLGNVTSQVSDSINWLSIFLVFISIIGSFFIAFFTIHYTQYLQQKRDFRAGIVWFLTEIAYLRSCLEIQLKNHVNEEIKRTEANPEIRNYGIFQFPDFSLNSYDFILSHGFVELLGTKNLQPLVQVKSIVQQLQYSKECYYLIINTPPSVITAKNYNENKLLILKTIQKQIDALDEIMTNFQSPQYPYGFFLNPVEIFRNFVRSNEKKENKNS